MSELGDDLIEGMQNALAYAKGEAVSGTQTTVMEIPVIDVRGLRKRLNLTQRHFAATFGFSLTAVRNWEQGTRRPSRTARILLALIEQHPNTVRETLSAFEKPHPVSA